MYPPRWWSQRSLFASVSMGQHWNREGGGVGKWNPVARSERDISGVHIIPMLLVCRASHFTSGRYSLTVYTQHCYAGMLGSILATVWSENRLCYVKLGSWVFLTVADQRGQVRAGHTVFMYCDVITCLTACIDSLYSLRTLLRRQLETRNYLCAECRYCNCGFE